MLAPRHDVLDRAASVLRSEARRLRKAATKETNPDVEELLLDRSRELLSDANWISEFCESLNDHDDTMSRESVRDLLESVVPLMKQRTTT